MSYVSCRDRRFPLRLEELDARVRKSYAFWLNHLVERIGASATRQLWNGAFEKYDSEFLHKILASGWQAAQGTGLHEGAPSPVNMQGEHLGPEADGMSAPEAQSLIEGTPPLLQIGERFPDVRVERETSAYESLHLSAHGVALLSEALIDSYGKQGELIAYDVISTQRRELGQRIGGRTTDFFRFLDEGSGTPDVFSAGLELENVKVSPTEHITLVKECEWARYFQERHPNVGYLVACSTDEAFARGFHESIRLVRTSTLMEGGMECDFRYYSFGAVPDETDKDD